MASKSESRLEKRRPRPPAASRPIVGALAPPRAHVEGLGPRGRAVAGPPWSEIPNGRRAESFADDLNTRRGIVSGRVALLPRSTEIQPLVAQIRPPPPPPPTSPPFSLPPSLHRPTQKTQFYHFFVDVLYS